MIGFVCGAVCACVVGAWIRGGGTHHPAVLEHVPSCDVSILLFGADAGSLVDAHTGGLGYSHAALHGCERTELGDAILDCRPGLGVARVPVDQVEGGRPIDLVTLPLAWARETYGAARASIGRPFTAGYDGAVCSQWIYQCLPLEAQRHVDQFTEYSWGGMVSPNQLAAAFWADRRPWITP